MLDHSTKDTMQDIDKRSLICRMFMSSTLEASVFMGKNYSENVHSVKNTGIDLTLKQMFDTSEKLIAGQSDEMFGVSQINREDSSWKQLCSMTPHGDLKTMNGNVLLTPLLCLYSQRTCPAGHWSFLGPGSEIKCYSTYNERPGGEWDRVAESMMIRFGESGHPVFRATSPLSRGTLKSKGG